MKLSAQLLSLGKKQVTGLQCTQQSLGILHIQSVFRPVFPGRAIGDRVADTAYRQVEK
jgi:hypothetical protein